jgi:hypothetical protein
MHICFTDKSRNCNIQRGDIMYKGGFFIWNP